MKIIVFGSTGRVGTFTLKYALAAGHKVTAFARDKNKVKISHPNLFVVEGDTYKPDTVLHALKKGFDAVIMAIGANPFKPSTVVTDSTKIIVNAMKQTGHKRYITVSGVTLIKKTLLVQFLCWQLIVLLKSLKIIIKPLIMSKKRISIG